MQDVNSKEAYYFASIRRNAILEVLDFPRQALEAEAKQRKASAE